MKRSILLLIGLMLPLWAHAQDARKIDGLEEYPEMAAMMTPTSAARWASVVCGTDPQAESYLASDAVRNSRFANSLDAFRETRSRFRENVAKLAASPARLREFFLSEFVDESTGAAALGPIAFCCAVAAGLRRNGASCDDGQGRPINLQGYVDVCNSLIPGDSR